MDDSNACQRCHQPLVLDPSITNLSPSSYSLLTSALPGSSRPPSIPATTKLASLPPSSRQGAEIWASNNGIPLPSQGGSSSRSVAESFVLLSDSILPSSSRPSQSRSNSGPSTSHSHPHTHHTSAGIGLSEDDNLTANLHAILSSKTPISHPLCTECTTLLQAELQKELEELSRERDAYIEFQRGIVRNRENLGKKRPTGKKREEDHEGLGMYDVEGTEEEWDELVKRKKDLEKEEDRLKKILEEKEVELEQARRDQQRVKEAEEEQERREEEFLLSHAALSTELRHLDETLSSAKTRLLLSQSLLAHLESTNVYNDAFQIGHVPLEATPAGGIGKGGLTVGTINGLRLGGRPIVEWDEINAAWGLVALCIDRIAVKVGCVFDGYKIYPLGSFSKIDELPPSKNSYELWVYSDTSPYRLLQNRRFSHALVSLLELLRQLVEFGRVKNRGWGVDNIEIRKDRISGHSIKLPGISAIQMPTLSSMSIMGLGSSTASTDREGGKDGKRDNDSSGEEQWTRACRAVLAVLKRILVVESEADRTTVAASAPAHA